MKIKNASLKGSRSSRLLSLVVSAVLAIQCFGATAAFAAEETIPAAELSAFALIDPDGGGTAPAEPDGGGIVPVEPDIVDELESAAASDAAVPDAAIETPSEQDVDVTEAWRAGSFAVSEAGRYYLSGDVETNGALFLEAPEGGEIIFDFNGHAVTVAGVVTAGIDASANKGSVVVTDTAYTEGGVKKNLTVEAVKAADAVAGILWNAAEDMEDMEDAVAQLVIKNIGVVVNINSADAEIEESRVHDAYGIYLGYACETENSILDAVDALDATIDNVSFAARVNNIALTPEEQTALLDDWGEKPLAEEESGVASAVFAKAEGIKLNGNIQSDLFSAGGTSDLYSTVPAAFILENDFAASRPLMVYADGNQEGVYFASFGEGVFATDELLASFEDASKNGFVCASDGNGLFFTVPPDDAVTEIADAIDEDAGNDAEKDEAPAESKGALETVKDAVQTFTESIASLFSISPLAEEPPININAKWTGTTYIITASGVYELTNDITGKTAAIRINGAGIDVTINLNGYTLKSTGQTGNGVIDIYNAKNVTIDGGVKDGKNGELISEGSVAENFASGIDADSNNAVTLGSLNIKNLDITVRPGYLAQVSGSTLSRSGIRAKRGEISLENCNVKVDLSQRPTAKAAPIPAGLYFGEDVSSANVENCAVDVIVPSNIKSSNADIKVNAYGIYSAANGLVSVKGGTFAAKSGSGSAMAVYAKNIKIDNDGSEGVILKADARDVAVGIEAVAQSGVVLNAKVAAELAGSSRYDLYSAVKNARFTIGPSFAAETPLRVWVGPDAESANGSGAYFAGYDGAPDEQRKADLKAMFESANPESPCVADADADGLYFKLDDESKAAAVVVHAGEPETRTFHSSIPAAIDALAAGETLKLLKPAANGITVPAKGGEGDVFSIDLNGNSAKFVSSASGGTVSLFDTASAKGTINGSDATGASAHLTAGELILNDISITTSVGDASHGAVCNDGEGAMILRGIVVNAIVDGLYITGVRNNKANGKIEIHDSLINIAGSPLLSYGVRAEAGGIAIYDSSVTVATSYAESYALTYGLYAGASASIAAEDTAVACSGKKVYAVYGGDGVKLSLKGCAVAANGTEADNYCFSSGEGVGSGTFTTAELALDGACGFNAPLAFKTPLRLGPDFALPEDEVAFLKNSPPAAENYVFAIAYDDGSDISAKAVYFEPLLGSTYDGWLIGAKDGNSKLVWTHDPVVENVTGNKEYGTLAAAVVEANDGDVLEVLDDLASAPLLVDKAFTLDLKGKTAAINAGTAAIGLAGALTYTGTGTFTLKDSGDGGRGKGSLGITVGESGSTANQGGGTLTLYNGIVNRSDGTLNLNDVHVSVTYAGTYTSTVNVPSYTLYGIRNRSGIVFLSGGAELTVNASRADGTFGALKAYGVYLDRIVAADEDKFVDGDGKFVEAPPASLAMDGTAKIVVNNNASGIEEGVVVNKLTGAATSYPTPLYLREISPAANSDQYKEIAEKFRQAAKFDAAGDAVGYGARVFYAAPLELADGTAVWAFSDVVPPGGEGKAEYLVPAKMFVQSKYMTLPEAYGIGAAAGANGDARLSAGSISADSKSGNATAVSAAGSGTWAFGNVTLYAYGSTANQRQQIGGFDLRTIIDGLDGSERIYYPKSSQVWLVADTGASAAGIAAAEDAALLLGGQIDIRTVAPSARDLSVSGLVVGSLFGTEGKLTVENPYGGNTAGSVFASAADGFALTQEHRKLFADAEGKLSPGLDEEGRLAWEAHYTVAFLDDGTVVRTNEGLVYGDTVALPSESSVKRYDTDAYTYQFLGWSTDPSASSTDGDGDISAGETTLAVTGNATYHTVFVKMPRRAIVTFSGMYDEHGAALPSEPFPAAYGKTFKDTFKDEHLSLSLPLPVDYAVGSASFRFVGWRVTVSNAAQIWDPYEIFDKLVFDYRVFGFTSGAASVSAVYAQVNAGQSLITFDVDNILTAYAVDKDKSPTYPTDPTKTSVDKTYTFEGWLKDGAGTPIPTAQLPKAAADTLYVASFSEAPRTYGITPIYYEYANGRYQLNIDLYSPLPPVQVAYGTDPFAAAAPESFRQGGTEYVFLGWSTRQGDKAPYWPIPAAGPAVTAAATYYAIYSAEPYTVTVTFKVGDEDYATAAGVTPGQQFVAAVFDGVGMPAPTPDGKVFKGWSAERNGTAITGQVDITEDRAYWAVFADPDQRTVTFYDEDETTVIKNVSVDDGATVASAGNAPTTPWKNAHYFTGWIDRFEDPFNLQTETITGDIDLHAAYAPIVKDVAAGSGASADLGGTSIVLPGIENAIGVRFALTPVQNADGDISGKTKDDGYAVLTAYQAELVYTVAGSGTGSLSGLAFGSLASPSPLAADAAFSVLSDTDKPILSDFGSVELTLPVADASLGKAKVYYLKEDGSVGVSAEKTVASGAINFTLTEYSLARVDRGNLVVAAYSASEKTDDPAPTGPGAATAVAVEIAAAQTQLDAQYAVFDKSKYSDANWIKLMTAYDTARKGIGAVTAAGAADAALRSGLSAMNAVPEASSTTTGSTSSSTGSTLGTSSNTSAANAGATGSGLASSSGTEASSATGASGSSLSSGATGSGLSGSGTTGSSATSGTGTSGSGLSAAVGTDTLKTNYAEAGKEIAALLKAFETDTEKAALVAKLEADPEMAALLEGLEADPGLEAFLAELGLDGGSEDRSGTANFLLENLRLLAELTEFAENENLDSDQIAAISAVYDCYVEYMDALSAYLESPDDPALREALLKAFSKLAAADERAKSILEPQQEADEEGVDATKAMLSADTPTSPGSDGLSEEADAGGFGQWAKNHIALMCVLGIVVLAAAAALVWWLLRRRNLRLAEGGFGGDMGEAVDGASDGGWMNLS